MTLQDIEALDREYLLMDEIAPILGAHPQTLRSQAELDPDKLGFPVIRYGKKTVTPKAGFLFFLRYGRPVVTAGYSGPIYTR